MSASPPNPRPLLGGVQAHLRAILVALAVVVAVLGLAAPAASAHPAAGVQNGVAAINPGSGPAVGSTPGVSPGSVGVSSPLFDDQALVSRVAPQTGDDDCGPVTLYRAVEPLELERIISDGYVYGVVDGWSEGKYFFPTSQQATDFARMNPDREYTLTSAEFSRSIFSDPEVWVDNIGGEGEAIFLPEKYFPHGPVRVHGSIP